MKLADRLKQLDKQIKLTKAVERGLKSGLKVGKKGLKAAEKGIHAIHKELGGPPSSPSHQRRHDVKTAPLSSRQQSSRTSSLAEVSTSAYHQIPMPAPPADGKYTVAYFTPWVKALEADWNTKKPAMDAVFPATLDTVTAAKAARDSASKTLNQLKKKDPPASKEEIEQAEGALKAESDAFEECINLLQTAASEMLKPLDISSDSYDDANLVTLFVLKSVTLEALESWCDKGDDETNRILDFLKNVPFMKRVVSEGGPYNCAKLGRALQIYYELQDSQDLSDPVLDRLALAVALELCEDVILFGYKNKVVDPLQRFVHYSQAYLLGELDPAFPSFSVWELRMAIDSDAPDEQLGWGRQCLQNYRPDHCYTNDSRWRYCRIVRTDVGYKNPDWYKPIHTSDQILSGGGKCGPRAWYGRFACKSFGIPTWGVRQPGHAAMSRWTSSKHWATCLGGGIHKSWWGSRGQKERGGLDFFLEADARSACVTDLEYLSKVQRIEWIAYLEGESNASIRQRTPLPSESSPWYAISMMQRRILASQGPVEATKLTLPDKPRQTKLETVLSQPDTDEPIEWYSDEKLVIPAASFKTSGKVFVMKSYLGGRQVFLHDDGNAEYDIPATKAKKSLTLTIQLCTVHRNEQPLKLTVTTDDGKTANLEVAVPYTMGLWENTEPVVLPSGATKLQLVRPKQAAGISYKELVLAYEY